MNDIENLLMAHDCDDETIGELRNRLVKAADGYSPLQLALAAAVVVKAVSNGTSDNDKEQQNLIMNLADYYDININ